MTARPNPIDVVELAYQLEGTDADWLRSLSESVRPLIDGGAGVLAYVYDVREHWREWLARAVSLDFTPDQIVTVGKMLDAYAPSEVNQIQRMPQPLGTLSEQSTVVGLENPLRRTPVRELFESIGACDSVALRTIEPSGKGIVLCGAPGVPPAAAPWAGFATAAFFSCAAIFSRSA